MYAHIYANKQACHIPQFIFIFFFIIIINLSFHSLSLLGCIWFVILLLESTSYKANENDDPTKAEKVEYSHHIADQNGIEMQNLYRTRYFIIKSLNHQNIRLSVDKGVWATQIMNEPILEEAFHVRSLLFWF